MSSLERPPVHARGSLHRPLLLALQRTVRLDRVEFDSALLKQKKENIFFSTLVERLTIKLVIGCPCLQVIFMRKLLSLPCPVDAELEGGVGAGRLWVNFEENLKVGKEVLLKKMIMIHKPPQIAIKQKQKSVKRAQWVDGGRGGEEEEEGDGHHQADGESGEIIWVSHPLCLHG